MTLLGIVLAAIYAALRVRFLWSGRSEESETALRDRDLALSLVASLVVILPTFATFDFLGFPMVTALAFLLAGISGALLRIVTAEVNHEPVDPYAVV